ncbi:threonine--tRNA ligase [Candidatus Woesearchaeota archaeon]|nr:threonine--tRNA ligase [Candidatus Woesearchaeota archaeon]
MKITFPDGSSKEAEKGMSALEICKKCIGEGLARSAIAAKVDDVLVDINAPINKDSKLQIITWKDDEGKEIMRHSTSHVMAQAVNRLYKNVKQGVGPAIEDGYYQDFELGASISIDDLPKIEEEMKKIVKEKLVFERKDMKKQDALKLFKDDPYKTEMINELEGDTVTVYASGEYSDLCKGPHVEHTGKIGAFKLTKVAGAYWRGDSKNTMLTRIYGIVFPTKHELEAHLAMIEEAEKRDHRKIGKAMDLFSFHEEAPGVPFWHPNGSIIYNKLVEFAKEENKKRRYNEIRTPTILNASMWKVSGHWDNFKEGMYFTKIDEQDFAVKPMNCPGGLLVYKSRIHSYRELPLRNAEFGFVHRHELSGVLSGLFRVRAFTQDDAHSFCTEEQIENEIIDMVEYAVKLYKTFGFKDIGTFIATRPEKSIGSDEAWELGTNALKNALKKLKMDYKIKEGEGAFYGPKIEFNLKDSIGRNWQCGTIQVDLSMPGRFDATYEAKDGTKKTPVMIHRAILGSLERFIGVVIEHFAGKFPLWINPVQIILLPIADRHREYCAQVLKKMQESGLRAEIDERAETINKKVRDAEVRHINYILVVGDKELKNKTVNIRTRDNEVLGEKKVDALVKQMIKEVDTKSLNALVKK